MPYLKNSEYFENQTWNIIGDAPVTIKLSSYAVIFNAGNFYYFGGYDEADLNSILRLNAARWKWAFVGKLKSARNGHGVILIDDTFMIIGGQGNFSNEACFLEFNGKFTCEEKVSSLDDYYFTPLMVLVNDDYKDNCTEIEAKKKRTVLVLAQFSDWLPAMLITTDGQQEELACFKKDDNTEAYNACSIIWKNQFFVFGGLKEKQQISRLSGYKLKRIGQLDFDHVSGACSVMANQFIFLCFNNAFHDNKLCWRSTGPLATFEAEPDSFNHHKRTKTSCSDSELFFCNRLL